MGRVFQREYTRNGARVRSKAWYVEYYDAGGVQRRKKVGPKAVAEAALAKLQLDAARVRAGVPDPAAGAAARARPLAELFAEYLSELRDRGRAGAYVKGVAAHLDEAATACGWHSWPDVTDAPFTKFLARLRAGTKARKGLAPATLNGYVRSLKGFAGWYGDKCDERNPLRGVPLFNAEVDKRRSQRVLTDAEFTRFLAATEACPPRHNALFTGPQRAALYRVAAYTGLRLSECASLTPDHFDLAAAVPVVRVHAADTKGKRDEPIPLHPDLVAFLRVWLDGKPGDVQLWPGRWARDRRHVRWVWRDAERAGLGPGVTFQGLRRQFVTGLIKSGADIDEVRKLARHKSVKTTLDHYAKSSLPELHAAVSKLPPQPPAG